MGEALYGGHEMLNHLGKVIRVTRKTIRALHTRNYVRRDRRSGLFQLRPEYYCVLNELESDNRDGFIIRELGRDCSGPNVPMCRCKRCSGTLADLDHKRLSNQYRWQKADEVVKAVTASKRGR